MQKNTEDAHLEMLEIDRVCLENMETDIREIKQIQRFIVSALPEGRERIQNVFKDKAGAADLFLALNKHPQTQKELEETLHMSQSNVSKLCTYLDDAGLIVSVKQTDRHNKYHWSDLAQRLGVSDIAKQFVKK